MKKLIAVTLATLMMASNVFAVGVKVNDTVLDQEAVIIDGRTLVPVRGVFEELGYTVSYDAETKTASLTNGTQTVSMTAGNTYFTVDGNEITPEVPQQIIDGRFMLPLRAVGEALGAEVNWDNETKTAIITKSQGLVILESNEDIDESAVNIIELK